MALASFPSRGGRVAVLALLLALAFWSGGLWARIYRYQDAEGRWQFSGQPPPGQVAEIAEEEGAERPPHDQAVFRFSSRTAPGWPPRCWILARPRISPCCNSKAIALRPFSRWISGGWSRASGCMPSAARWASPTPSPRASTPAGATACWSPTLASCPATAAVPWSPPRAGSSASMSPKSPHPDSRLPPAASAWPSPSPPPGEIFPQLTDRDVPRRESR